MVSYLKDHEFRTKRKIQCNCYEFLFSSWSDWMRLDKRKEWFKNGDLIILTCYQTLHSVHPKHCSTSPAALWDGHLLLHPTADERRALSLNPEGSLVSFTLLLFTVEATLKKSRWTINNGLCQLGSSPPLSPAVTEAVKSSKDICPNSSKVLRQAPIPSQSSYWYLQS